MTARKKANGKANGWIPEKPYVPLPRSLLKSPAWRSLGVNARRLIEFLMIEHLDHGGRENGFLRAPRRQLVAFGIHTHCISTAIAEAERVGLVDCIRGTGKAANRYALTWIPLKGQAEPTNRWREHEPQPPEA